MFNNTKKKITAVLSTLALSIGFMGTSYMMDGNIAMASQVQTVQAEQKSQTANENYAVAYKSKYGVTVGVPVGSVLLSTTSINRITNPELAKEILRVNKEFIKSPDGTDIVLSTIEYKPDVFADDVTTANVGKGYLDAIATIPKALYDIVPFGDYRIEQVRIGKKYQGVLMETSGRTGAGNDIHGVFLSVLNKNMLHTVTYAKPIADEQKGKGYALKDLFGASVSFYDIRVE